MHDHISPTEHLRRLARFAKEAQESSDLLRKSDLIIAAVSAAAAFYQNMLEQARRGMIRRTEDEVTERFLSAVRRSGLIIDIRVHDFHRRPVSFLPGLTALHGPGRLQVTGPGSTASIGVTPDGEKIVTRLRNAAVKENRPITVSGYAVEDPYQGDRVDVLQAIQEYFADARALWESGWFHSNPESLPET